jgi:carbamoyl-phosphate synthase large subunit
MSGGTPADWRGWTIALTGMNARPDNPGPGLAVARCIREADGFAGRLIGLGYQVLDPGLYDHGLMDAAYLMPCPSTGRDRHLERLLGIHAQHPIDVVIPCLDAEMDTFARNEAALAAAGIRMLVPSSEQIAARGKDRLPSLCAEIGIATPRTEIVADSAFFDQCRDQGWSYPLMVKGLFYEAEKAHSAAAAKAVFYDIFMRWGLPILAQEFVKGYEVNLVALGDGEGGLLGPVMMRKRAVTEKGKAWAGVTIIDAELERLARTFVAATGWRGPLEVEALRGEDGALYLIEVNPRFPAWVYLSHGVGCNLPAALLRLMAGERPLDLAPPVSGSLFIRCAEERIIPMAEFQSLMIEGQR